MFFFNRGGTSEELLPQHWVKIYIYYFFSFLFFPVAVNH